MSEPNSEGQQERLPISGIVVSGCIWNVYPKMDAFGTYQRGDKKVWWWATCTVLRENSSAPCEIPVDTLSMRPSLSHRQNFDVVEGEKQMFADAIEAEVDAWPGDDEIPF